MAKFLIQSDSCLKFENEVVKGLLTREGYGNLYLHDYIVVGGSEGFKEVGNGYIPIGNIEFVTGYLNDKYRIEKQNPIEIPKYLRTDEFLKRDYHIVDWMGVPLKGRYFLKDVTELKKFADVVNMDCVIRNGTVSCGMCGGGIIELERGRKYQVSDVFDIQSEWRIYVVRGVIESIACYNGDCTVLPDMVLIKKAVGRIGVEEKYLRSYTIDVMVGKWGTALIEIHNFTSVGLYCTLWGNNLLYAYIDGIDYLLNCNKELE